MPDMINSIAHDNGFDIISAEAVPEIDGDAFQMVHRSSGAKLLFLRNDDDDKAFSISFKTPAADDTGVFHILEHSVLCGSRKFSVKEPFVNLLKSSMQTFLNAMTFPDKTMYPVASTNEQDLLNLMDVYLDAVFHPNIYRNEMIFEQEGWHIEEAEGERTQSGLVYNGVVFNEMKGALSDTESVLYDTLSAALFPDTTYRFESGGTPVAIPELTYEAFLDGHRRHYRPDNSFIVLYGNLDADRFLSFLDKEYLAAFDRSALGPLDINPLVLQSPITPPPVVRTMDSSPDNSCMALGYVVSEASDVERVVAIDILMDALMGSNEAPLKRVLLDAGIADDCKGYLADSVRQPFAVLQIKGLATGAEDQFERLVDETMRSLAAGGLDKAIIEAALSHAEFVMREHAFGYPDGVVLSMAALSGWLYSDDGALDYIRYEDVYASLRRKLEGDYFCSLIEEVFCKSDHKASARIKPISEDVDATTETLQGRLSALSADEASIALEKAAALKKAQMAPDAPEEVAKLPKLTRDDIGEAACEPAFHLEERSCGSVLLHDVETHGIVYATRYFDVSCVSFDEMFYLSLLAKVLGKLDCAETTAAEMDTLIQSKLGNLSFSVEVYEDLSVRSRFYPRFVVGASALVENTEAIAELANEIMCTSCFSDFDRIHDILLQRKVAFEQTFALAGHSVAAARAATYYSPAAVLRDALSGIECYRMTLALLADFDERKEGIADKLSSLATRMFSDEKALLSFAGPEGSLERLINASFALGARSDVSCDVLKVPAPKPRREAFIVPSDVSYTALSADRRDVDPEYSGTWSVASRILSFDYLWNEVRVLGGAYGCGFNASLAGTSFFYSYRDPHLDETVERFKEAGKWLASFAPSDEEFTGYVVSTVASIDNPLKPRDLIKRQDTMHITGYTPEARSRVRLEALQCTLDEVRSLGDKINALACEDHLCSVGSREIIEGSSVGFDIEELC